MRHKIPTVSIGVSNLLQQPKNKDSLLHFPAIDSVEWYTWLELQVSFFFESIYGTFTARKEKRYGSWYWYAYRRYSRKLRTAYLGKTGELTLERLNEVAQILSSTNAQTKGGDHKEIPEKHFYPIPPNAPPWHTKLSISSIPANLVARPHLTQCLSKGMSHKLVLISAAAGSGKTTLVREWVRQSRYSVAWVTLDELDNNLEHFWSVVIWALETIYTGIAKETLELLHVPEPKLMESVLTLLINTLAVIPYEFALVLDDYHILNTKSIHDTVTFLLNHLPPNMHLIIASRSNPPLPLARLRANGDLIELCNTDLHFLPHEARTFLTQNVGLNFSKEILSTLESRTEGWIAGLQLMALSLQRQNSHQGSIEVATGSNHYILDYLVEEILLPQHQNIQTFLLYTSILEHLSTSLCNAVTEQNSSQRYLEQLERSNLFLFSLESQPYWYRYHCLFKEVLYSCLQNNEPNIIPVLYTRAYIWCEQHNLLPEAIYYAVSAGAFEQIARFSIRIRETMIKQCEVITLLTWLNKLSDELVRSHTQLCLLLAWALMILRQFKTTEQLLWKVESSLDGRLNEYPFILFTEHGDLQYLLNTKENDAAIQNLLGEAAAMHALFATSRGDTSSTIIYAHKAFEYLPLSSLYLRGLSTLNLGIAYWLQNDLVEAEQAFMQTCIFSSEIEYSNISIIAICTLAQIQMTQGQRRQAAESSKLALKMVPEGHSRSLPVAAYAYIGMGQHYYEWNDLETATLYFEQGITLSEQAKSEDLSMYGYTELARVKQAQGDKARTIELVQQVEQYMQSGQEHSWIVNAMIAQQARLALAQEDAPRAKYWMQYLECRNLPIFMKTLYARIFIAQGQLDNALEIVEQQLPIARSKKQLGLVIELYVLEAMAYQRKNDGVNALLALGHALLLAEPEGYIRMFINEGEPMVTLLAEALTIQRRKCSTSSSNALREYVRKLLLEVDTSANAAVHMLENKLPATHQPSFEAFSKREREIVQLIAAGMSNQNIAQQLVIAETTVKWHIKNIFSKLNVRSRSQIIILARKLRW